MVQSELPLDPGNPEIIPDQKSASGKLNELILPRLARPTPNSMHIAKPCI
jgi:hypothetical protein